MKIDNLLRVSDGMLQNIPSVDHIESIQIDALHVKRGDLFLDIHNSFQNRECAIENGAYAIISEKIENITDREIAWIEVSSLRLACVKLARYEFVRKNCKILYMDDVELEIFQSIIKNKEYKSLPHNAFNALLTLNQSGENTKFICSDKRLSFSIDSTASELKQCYNINILESKSPFYSSFIANDIFYENIRIPSIFVHKLCLVMKYLDSKDLEYNLNNISLKNHFGAVFTDLNLYKKEFGQGEKVLIFENNIDYLSQELKHLEEFSKDTVFFAPLKFKNFLSGFRNLDFFRNIDELKEFLITTNSRYTLLLLEYNKYHTLVNHRKKEQLTLNIF